MLLISTEITEFSLEKNWAEEKKSFYDLFVFWILLWLKLGNSWQHIHHNFVQLSFK